MDNNNGKDIEDRDLALVIARIKESSMGEKAAAGVVALLNVIPVVGGTIASILSEYRSRRNTERVVDALTQLKEAIEDKGTDFRVPLSEDQVVEVVHNALEELTKTSSQEKATYLRNAFTKSFTHEEIDYLQKQYYLTTLSGLSLGEIELLKVIYVLRDPFVDVNDLPNREEEVFRSRFPNATTTVFPYRYYPRSYETTYRDPIAGKSLSKVLEEDLKQLSLGTLEGLIRSLDAKGLSNISPNLGRRTMKFMTEVQGNIGNSGYLTILSSSTGTVTGATALEVVQSTPIEASSTPFGQDFLKYVQYP